MVTAAVACLYVWFLPHRPLILLFCVLFFVRDSSSRFEKLIEGGCSERSVCTSYMHGGYSIVSKRLRWALVRETVLTLKMNEV